MFVYYFKVSGDKISIYFLNVNIKLFRENIKLIFFSTFNMLI